VSTLRMKIGRQAPSIHSPSRGPLRLVRPHRSPRCVSRAAAAGELDGSGRGLLLLSEHVEDWNREDLRCSVQPTPTAAGCWKWSQVTWGRPGAWLGAFLGIL
jgi:hypothetical protein